MKKVWRVGEKEGKPSKDDFSAAPQHPLAKHLGSSCAISESPDFSSWHPRVSEYSLPSSQHSLGLFGTNLQYTLMGPSVDPQPVSSQPRPAQSIPTAIRDPPPSPIQRTPLPCCSPAHILITAHWGWGGAPALELLPPHAYGLLGNISDSLQ